MRRCPDIAKAVGVLGWRPQVPLAEGVRRTAEWLLSKPADIRLARLRYGSPGAADPAWTSPATKAARPPKRRPTRTRPTRNPARLDTSAR